MNTRVSNTKAAICLALTACILAPLPALAAQKSQYLPPEAPRLDSAAFKKPDTSYQSKGSNSQNDYTADSRSSLPSPVADLRGDRTKELLHQALERHNQGDLSGAQRLFQQVLSQDPNNSDANFNLGAMAEDKGDLQSALNYYQKASNANPSDSDVRDAISSIEDKMRQQKATQQLAQKQQLRPIAQDAAAAYKAGHYDQSINDLQQILRQTPDDASAFFGLGQAYRGKGDNQQARMYLGRAVALAPDNQLYQSSLSDLDRAPQQQLAQGPSAAPDYSGGGRRGRHSHNDYTDASDQSASGSDQGLQNYSDNGSNISSNSGSDGVTPFTSQGAGALYGHESGNSNFAPMARGGGGLGSMLGMGMLGGGLSRMVGGGGYGSGYGYAYPGRGTRLVRNAVAGSLAGAAIGALTSMHGAGGMRGGAMRGAVTGGIMGLITGL